VSALLRYQARWAGDSASVRVAAKARRTGFTFAEMPRQVLRAGRSRMAGGCDCYYISTSQRLGRKYIETCARWAKALNIGVESVGEKLLDVGADILAQEIRFSSGFSIKALPSNPEAIRGEGGSVLLDEAAFHDNLYELLKAIYAVPDWGGDIAIVSTYNGVDNEFYDLVEEIKAGRRRASLHEVNIYDALADGLHRRRCATQRRKWTAEDEAAWLADKLSSPGADEEYLCIARRSGGVYIRRDLIEECMTVAGEVARLELPADHMFRAQGERDAHIARWCEETLVPLLHRLERGRITTMGVDFARSGNGDLSIMVPMQESRTLQKVVPWLIELRGVPYDEQWAILKFIGDWLCAERNGLRFGGATIDSGGSGGWLGEKALAYWGEALVDALKLSEEWYSENLPPLRSAFEEHEILLVKDSELRDDLLMFQKNRRGVPKLVDSRRRDSRDSKPRHGDAAIALALAFSRHARAPAASDFRRVPKPSEQRRDETRHRRRHAL